MFQDSKILIVEDDKSISGFIELELKHLGFDIAIADNGTKALELSHKYQPDLIVLDVMIPKISGYEVCEQIRKKGKEIPIIMLTARRETTDVVQGLEKGADDYIKKPFEMPELLARIRALLRRNQKSAVLKYQDLIIDTSARSVTKNNKEIELTSKEFDLLCYLVTNKEVVLTRKQIYENVWEELFIGNTNVVDVLMRRLRRKIDEPFKLKLLQTIHGAGYVLRKNK